MLSSNFQSDGIFYPLRLDVVVKGWIGQRGENQVRVSMGTKNKREIFTYKKNGIFYALKMIIEFLESFILNILNERSTKWCGMLHH